VTAYNLINSESHAIVVFVDEPLMILELNTTAVEVLFGESYIISVGFRGGFFLNYKLVEASDEATVELSNIIVNATSYVNFTIHQL